MTLSFYLYASSAFSDAKEREIATTRWVSRISGTFHGSKIFDCFPMKEGGDHVSSSSAVQVLKIEQESSGGPNSTDVSFASILKKVMLQVQQEQKEQQQRQEEQFVFLIDMVSIVDLGVYVTRSVMASASATTVEESNSSSTTEFTPVPFPLAVKAAVQMLQQQGKGSTSSQSCWATGATHRPAVAHISTRLDEKGTADTEKEEKKEAEGRGGAVSSFPLFVSSWRYSALPFLAASPLRMRQQLTTDDDDGTASQLVSSSKIVSSLYQCDGFQPLNGVYCVNEPFPSSLLEASSDESAMDRVGKVLLEDAQEVGPIFDSGHYPKGVNSNFYTMTAEELEEKFGGEKGIFHDKESRDIAAAVNELATTIVMQSPCPSYCPITLLELGCGTGLVTEALMNALDRCAASAPPQRQNDGEEQQLQRSQAFEWKLLATEISRGFISLAQRRIQANYANAKDKQDSIFFFAHAAAELASIPTCCVDICPIIDVYHHFEQPKTMLREIHRVLKPNGRIFLCDFIRDTAVHKSHPDDWVLKHVRAGQEVFEAEVIEAGFKKVREVKVPGIVENYCVVFEKSLLRL